MVAVYAYMVMSLAVTVLIAIDEDFRKDRDPTRDINRWGAVASVVLLALAFLALDFPSAV